MRQRPSLPRLRICLAAACVVTTVAIAARAQPTPAAPLRVAMSGDYTPFSFRDAAGALTGFEVTVAQRLAADLGRPLSMQLFRWPELVTRLRVGDFDIAMSGVTVRADRAVALAFTRPYAVTGAVAVIRAADRAKYRGLAALDRGTVRIAVNAGGHLERVARMQFPHAQLTTVTNNATLPDLLRRNAVDAVISEEFEARAWAGQGLATIGPFTHDRKAYAVPLHDLQLRNQVDAWLAAREADGWLDQQRTATLGAPGHTTAQQACFEAVAAAMDLRLQMMPFVATAKRRTNVPLADPEQETAVLARTRTAAETLGLQGDSVVKLFRVQIDAAKVVQAHAADVPDGPPLAEVRSAIAAVSDQLLHELARCAAWLESPGTHARLDATMRACTGLHDLAGPLRERMLAALHRVRSSGADQHSEEVHPRPSETP